MSYIKENLEKHIRMVKGIGHFPLIEEFVLHTGQEFTKLYEGNYPLGEPKECFQNAVQFCFDNGFGEYVEGYAINKKVGLPFLHAWVEVDDEIIEPTLLHHTDYEYFGVKIGIDRAWEEVQRNGYYGIYDNPTTLVNVRFMVDFDPTFVQQIPERIRKDCGL